MGGVYIYLLEVEVDVMQGEATFGGLRRWDGVTVSEND